MLEIVRDATGEDYELMKEYVFKELSTIVQNSSLVECINSILRPYFLNIARNITSLS